MINRRLLVPLFLLVADSLAIAQSDRMVVPAEPFIAAWERFAPHDRISAADAGQLLVRELNCAACHGTPNPLLKPAGGPNLNGAGQRYQEQWLIDFLQAPSEVAPGTTMPAPLAHLDPEDRLGASTALAAFLMTRQDDFPQLSAGGALPLPHRFWERGRADEGHQLYHEVGCVACHEPWDHGEAPSAAESPIDRLLATLEPDELEEMGLGDTARTTRSVPISTPERKFTAAGLTWLLYQPSVFHAESRMPEMMLTPTEAADIAAWLLESGGVSDPLPVDTRRAEESDRKFLVNRGRLLFSELGCRSCHEVNGIAQAPSGPPLATLNWSGQNHWRGELRKGQPLYTLTEAQRASVRDGADLAERLADSVTPETELRHEMLSRNCYACHERNGLGGVARNRRPNFLTAGHVDIGDEGRIPPALTGVGWKVRLPWLEQIFRGKERLRPFMKTRMPRLSNKSAQRLATWLGRADAESELSIRAGEAHRPETTQAAAGRELMNTGCVQCHVFDGNSLPGTVGVDLARTPQRLNRDWFDYFLQNPIQVKRGTRMPSFFPKGVSQRPDVLHGDREAQIAALWDYLEAGPAKNLPQRILESERQSYELTPSDRPILLRTFMKEAGTHTVAVGLPVGTHFAFDANRCAPVMAWTGRFIDARGTWFIRFAPEAEPLGDNIIRLDDAIQLKAVANGRPLTARFRGYELDQDGVPSFLYSLGRFHVRDRMTSSGAGVLERRLHVQEGGEGPSTRLFVEYAADTPAGLEVRSRLGESEISAPNGLASETQLVPDQSGIAEIMIRYQWAGED